MINWRGQGFTLIELLVVVAIIAILVVIAIPNLLEAQTRSKVSRGQADLRTIDMGLKQYFLDYNAFIPSNNYSLALWVPGLPRNQKPTLELLTTPIPYISTIEFKDPFPSVYRMPYDGVKYALTGEQQRVAQLYKYALFNETGVAQFDDPKLGTWYLLESSGPDCTYHNMSGILYTWNMEQLRILIYDPTNGTVSDGSIWRLGGQPNELGKPLWDMVWASGKSVGN